MTKTLGVLMLETLRRRDEGREQRRILLEHDPARRGARDDPVPDREVEGRGAADVAARARKARLQHEHAQAAHQSDVAARAAWSYRPDIVRSSRAISPMSGLRSVSRLAIRHASRTSR